MTDDDKPIYISRQEIDAEVIAGLIQSVSELSRDLRAAKAENAALRERLRILANVYERTVVDALHYVPDQVIEDLKQARALLAPQET